MEIQHTKMYECCVLSHVQLCDPTRLCNPTRLPCLWNSPGKNTGVGCHSLLQGISPTQGSFSNQNVWGAARAVLRGKFMVINAYLKKQEIAQIDNLNLYFKKLQGLPWWLSGKESACQCRRYGFDSWSRKIPHISGDSARAPKLLSLCSRAWGPQLLKPSCPTAYALQQERPLQWEARALQLELSSLTATTGKSNQHSHK